MKEQPATLAAWLCGRLAKHVRCPRPAIVGSCVVLVALAGCADQNDGFAALDHPAPLTVLSNMPFGITPNDLRVKNGCYYYESGGDILPVNTPQMRAQGLTGPYCLG